MTTLILPPGSKQFGTFDTLSDRRDLWRLLERLDGNAPAEVGCARRRDFLRWCCRAVAGVKPGPVIMDERNTVGLTGEVWNNVIALAAQYGLSLDAAAVELERELRRLGL